MERKNKAFTIDKEEKGKVDAEEHGPVNVRVRISCVRYGYKNRRDKNVWEQIEEKQKHYR